MIFRNLKRLSLSSAAFSVVLTLASPARAESPQLLVDRPGNYYRGAGNNYEEISKSLSDYTAHCESESSTIYGGGAAEIANLATQKQLSADQFRRNAKPS